MNPPTGLLLYQLLEHVGASTRAKHTTRAANISLDLYFTHGKDFEQILLKVPNLGSKVCKEIIELIEKSIESGILDEFIAEQSSDQSNEAALQELRGMDLHSFLVSNAAGIRALNATIGTDLTISDYLNNKKRFRARLLSTNNIGKKTYSEIVSLIEAAISETPKISSWRHVGVDIQQQIMGSPLPLPLSLEKQILTVFETKLSERSREVISLRGGIFADEAMTLDGVGTLYRVTRERIRQIEKNAKRTMSNLLAKHREAIVDAWIAYLPKQRFDYAPSNKEIRSLWKEMPAYLRLGLFCLDVSPEDILNHSFYPYGAGWLLDDSLIEAVKRVDPMLLARSKEALPTPISHLANSAGVSVEEMSTILKIHDQFQNYRGYLIKRPAYRRVRRMVELHELLSRGRAKGPQQLSKLLLEYQSEQAVIPCTTRDALVVMAEQGKGLFLNCYEYGWYPLPPYPVGEKVKAPYLSFQGEPIVALQPQVNEDNIIEESSETADDDLTIEGLLAEILAEGPMSFEELRDAFLERRHSWSSSSVAPILIGSNKFQRVAPGVYALTASVNAYETIKRGESILLSDKHCKLYCQARWAGEPGNLYPYWGASMELRWASMLTENKDEMLFGSLMAVASVNGWPVSEERKVYWQQRQIAAAKYLLEEPPGEIDMFAYTTRQIVAASIQALQEKRTSWMACNRASGKRVDDRHSCSLLAILMRLGVVDGAEHWQREHKLTSEASTIVNQMLEILATWPDIVISKYVREIDLPSKAIIEGAWLESARIKQDIDESVLRSGSLSKKFEPAEHGHAKIPDISAQILSMHRRRRL